jgi:hemerythrin-like domain-containing protein
MSTPRRTARPSSPFARFREDHARVLARLGALEASAPGPGRRVEESRLRHHLEALAGQFDTHMAAEEAVLYPTLARAFPEAAGTLQPLHEEHADLREMLAGLLLTLERPASRARDVQIAVQVHDITDLLRVHIRKEEAVVFDVSERVLPARELRGLASRLAPFFPANDRRASARPGKGRTSS